MSQDVVGTDELKAPIKRVEDVCLLCYELVISEWRLDVLKQLAYSWIGLLVIFSGDEDAGDCNQSEYVALGLSTKVWNSSDVVNDVRSLQVGVQCVDGMMESLWLMVKFAT